MNEIRKILHAFADPANRPLPTVERKRKAPDVDLQSLNQTAETSWDPHISGDNSGVDSEPRTMTAVLATTTTLVWLITVHGLRSRQVRWKVLPPGSST